MKAFFVKWWNEHLQKTLGLIEVAFGMAEYIDQATINLVGGFLGPKWGPIVSKSIQIVAGLGVTYRAFQAHKPGP